MKEIITLGQTEIANSRMSPWYIAATTAVTQGSHSHYISRAHLYIDISVTDTNLHPEPLLCTLIWQVPAEAQASRWVLQTLPLILATLLSDRLQLKTKKQHLTFACWNPKNPYIKPRVN